MTVDELKNSQLWRAMLERTGEKFLIDSIERVFYAENCGEEEEFYGAGWLLVAQLDDGRYIKAVCYDPESDNAKLGNRGYVQFFDYAKALLEPTNYTLLEATRVADSMIAILDELDAVDFDSELDSAGESV